MKEEGGKENTAAGTIGAARVAQIPSGLRHQVQLFPSPRCSWAGSIQGPWGKHDLGQSKVCF